MYFDCVDSYKEMFRKIWLDISSQVAEEYVNIVFNERFVT